ncbi:MAG: hypothetical protein RLZZ508_293 [Actinomycetota bacterium]
MKNVGSETVAWVEINSQIKALLENRNTRPEVKLDHTAAPARLATHTAAIVADVDVNGEEVGNGRLVVLFEPLFQDTWDGNLRLVGFVSADLETELVTDPMLLEVGWSWVEDAFKGRAINPLALSGTVSRSGSQSFGDLSMRQPEGQVEIRVSWTVPADEAFTEHALAWVDLMTSAAGLEPLPEGVSAISLKK